MEKTKNNISISCCYFIKFVCFFFFLQCNQSQENSVSNQFSRMRNPNFSGAIPVKVDTVKIESISTYILTNTTLEAQRQVDIIARVSGIVKKINVEEGDIVNKQSIILNLDDRELRLNMEQAKAKMENTLNLFNRSKDMFEKNLISKEMFDDSKFQYETAKSQYENALLQLQYASIRAPLSGIITQRVVEIGDYVTANRIVFTMADFDTLLARIYVPEKEISNIKLGQVARLHVEAYAEKDFFGKVKMINPVVDPTTGTIKVTIEIDKKNTGLLPGMFSSVYLLTDTHENAKVIPKKALILESETDRLFVYQNGKAQLRDVKTGFTDGNRLEIVNGLEAGDLVVVVGQEGLRDGANVRISGYSESGITIASETSDNISSGSQTYLGRNEKPNQEISQERLKQIIERMMQRPEVREEYEKRVKEEPELASDMEKKMEFIREMREKFGGRGRRGQ